MDDICGLVDTEINSKKTSINVTTLDTIKNPQHAYHTTTTLMDLNDDCLLTILENLSKIDLCHVQTVCTRFVRLAEDAFRINIIRRPSWRMFQMEDTMSKTRRIYNEFGHLFQSLHAAQHEIRCEVLQRLTRLESLTLVLVKIDWEMVSALHSAKHLKVLNMYSCKFVDASKTSRKSLEGLQKEMSSLYRLTCQAQLPPLHIFEEFLQYNQELKRLGLPIDIPANYAFHIVNHAKQLIELVLFISESNKFKNTEIGSLLSNLRNLRLLTINGSVNKADMDVPRATPLWQGLKQAISDITDLTLNGFTINEEVIKVISEMKKLQHLVVKGNFYCSGLEFVSLVHSLPELINLTFSFESCFRARSLARASITLHQNFQKFDFTINFNVLKGIVEAGKNLKFLKLLYVREIRIDNDDYADLFNVFKKSERKEKLSIAIEGCKVGTTFDVPLNVQRTDLKIDYSTVIPCKCVP